MRYISLLQSRFLKRGVVALAVLTAAVFAVGIQVDRADAQTAAISAAGPYEALAGRPVQLNGILYARSAIAANWTFSDGTSIDGLSVVKAFSTPGSYTATLAVTDAAGLTYADSTTVTVYAWPTGVTSSYVLVNGQLILVDSLGGLSGIPASSIATLLPGQIVTAGQTATSTTRPICEDPSNPLYAITCLRP
jgi:hypothetical protein